MKQPIEIPHGGGTGALDGVLYGGNSHWARKANGCLVEAELLESGLSVPCDKLSPNLMIGTLVHEYAREELEHGLDQDERLAFVDTPCNWEISEEIQDEAYRVYCAWRKIRQPIEGIEGIELLLRGDKVTAAMGVPLAAKVDLIETVDGQFCLTDFKTASARGDRYSTGSTRIQLQLYTMAAWAMGWDIQRIRVRQIVKTKTVQEHIYEIDLPTPEREIWLKRYLLGAKKRYENRPQVITGDAMPAGAACDWCYFQKTMQCPVQR